MNLVSNKTFVVAGIPRSGTTMVFRALAGLPRGATTPKDYEGPIVKTHTPKPQQLKRVDKAIFLFGDPVASVISTRQKRWTLKHFKNCGVNNVPIETADIYAKDFLGYEKMFDAWTRRQGFDTICVRYERIHDNLQILNSFFGQHLYIPPYRDRNTDVTTSVDQETLAKIQKNYRSFIDKVKSAPDVMIYKANSI